MYSNTSCSVQNDNGLDCGFVCSKALHPNFNHDCVLSFDSSAFVPTYGFRLDFVPYLANGCFFITPQQLAEHLNGASIKYCHFFGTIPEVPFSVPFNL
jgi:hypothetical protein